MAGLDKRKFFRKKMYIFKIRNEKKAKTCINSYVPILEKTKKKCLFLEVYTIKPIETNQRIKMISLGMLACLV